MGNALVCCRVAKAVRVYHGDTGHLLKFSLSPIPSVSLMREHPNYLILYTAIQKQNIVAASERRLRRHQFHIRVVLPGDLLQLGQAYFIVYIPGQHRAVFAKHFLYARKRTEFPPASPQSRHVSSTLSSSERILQGSAKSIRNPTSPLSEDIFPLQNPARSPLRTSRPNRTPPRRSPTPRSPLAPFVSPNVRSSRSRRSKPEMTRQYSYVPSPLRGHSQGTTQVAYEQRLPLNLEQANRVPSPGGLTSSSRQKTYVRIINQNLSLNRTTLANMINEDMKGSPNRFMDILQRPSLPQPQVQGARKSTSDHNLPRRDLANTYIRSPGRAVSPAQGSLRNILYNNLRLRSPGNDLMIQRSPGPPTRILNHHPKINSKGSSPHYLNRSPINRPSRSGPQGKQRVVLRIKEMLSD